MGLKSTRTEKFFWAMFRLRLMLIALLLPVAVTIVVEIILLFRTEDYTLPLIRTAMPVAFLVTGLLLVSYFVAKIVTDTDLELLVLPFLFVINWAVLPCIGLLFDLVRAPRIWIARLIEALVLHGKPKPEWKVSLGMAVLELIVFMAVFIGSFTIWRPWYREWTDLTHFLATQNEHKTRPQGSTVSHWEIEAFWEIQHHHLWQLSSCETVGDLLKRLEEFRANIEREREIDSVEFKQEIFAAITAGEESLEGRDRNEKTQESWYPDWHKAYLKSLDDLT